MCRSSLVLVGIAGQPHLLGVPTTSDCASDWERKTYDQMDCPIWNRIRGSVRSVPAENVFLACLACRVASFRPVIASNWSQQQPFIPLSRASDVDSRPSQSASSQQSALVHLPNPPIWKVHARTNQIHPSAAAEIKFNSDSANLASALSCRPLSKNGMYGSDLRPPESDTNLRHQKP